MNFTVNMLQKLSNDDLYLEVGDHSFPFRVILPMNLPTSFEHHIGRIRYSIEGIIDIPWYIFKMLFKWIVSIFVIQQNY